MFKNKKVVFYVGFFDEVEGTIYRTENYEDGENMYYILGIDGYNYRVPEHSIIGIK